MCTSAQTDERGDVIELKEAVVVPFCPVKQQHRKVFFTICSYKGIGPTNILCLMGMVLPQEKADFRSVLLCFHFF